MSIQANKTMVGAFVLGAAVLLAAAILLLGSGRLFKSPATLMLYFDGSVKGLTLGAPVVFRGVPVGAVTDIRLVGDATGQYFRIPVEIQIDPSKIMMPKDSVPVTGRGQFLKKLVDDGLRAQLGLQSFVTGQLMIELDMHPGSELRLRGDGSLPEIPTLPSSLDKLAKTLQSIPFDQIISQTMHAMESINNFLNSPGLADTGGELSTTLHELQGLVHTLNSQLKPMGVSLDKTLASVAAAADSADRALRNAENAMAGDSQGMTDFKKTLEELGAAARALRNLADYLERHPESLLKGKGEYR